MESRDNAGREQPLRPGMIAEDAPCPATGRTLWTRPEWNNTNDHYMLRIGTSDGRIIVARAFGRVNLDDTNEYCRRIEFILAEFYQPGKPLFILDEYSRLGKVENLSRERYANFYATKQDCIGALVFTGLHPLIRLYVKLSQRLASPAYPVLVFDAYAEGIRACQELLGKDAPVPATTYTLPLLPNSPREVDYVGTHFTAHAEMLSNRIVLIRERGRLEAHDVPACQESIEQFLMTQLPKDKGYSIILDQSGFLGQTAAVARKRREAYRRMELLFGFESLVIIDRHTPFTWLWRLLRRLHPRVRSARNRDEALELLSSFEGDPDTDAMGMGLHRRKGSRPDQLAHELLTVIATIPWDRSSAFENPYSLRHPLRAVVDSLLVVKNDFDDLMRDRTQREADLVRAREAAESALSIRSQFLANMSHEIRTPMNGIVGMAELLQASNLPLEQQHQIALLKRSADSLLTLLNDILDYSRLEARKLEPESIPFELPVLLEDIRVLFSGIASRKHLTLKVHCPPSLPHMLCGDAGRLRQILANLVGNAVKFTQNGSVCVRVGAGQIHDESIDLQFRVEDTGIGIGADQLERIFEPFRQVDGSITRRFGGTGLGLSISQQLVELLGGTIEVDSSPGKGTIFSFTLALEISRTPSTSPPHSKPILPLQGRRILLVEDNEVNRVVAQGILRRMEIVTTCAEDGAQALEALRSGSFDLVLMDIQMPVMDGIEAIRRIRSGEAGAMAANIPIVALTANALSGDRDHCLEAGADAYLAKPVRSIQLRETLARLLHPAAT